MPMNTLERLQNLLIKDYGLAREALTAHARLDSLDMDSLGLIELWFQVEKEFSVDVPTEQPELTTVGDVATYIDGLQAHKIAQNS